MTTKPSKPCAGCGVLRYPSLHEGAPEEHWCQSCRRSRRCGSPSGYRKGCRCHQCRKAQSEHMRAYAARRRSEGRPLSRGTDWHVSRKRRTAIYDRDGWTCQLCNKVIDPDVDPLCGDAATLDHIVPRSLGGSHDDDNLRLACRSCNSIRGNRIAA